jgi:hypothetical protein
MVNPLKFDFGYNLGSWKLNTAKKNTNLEENRVLLIWLLWKKLRLYGIYIDKEYRWYAD